MDRGQIVALATEVIAPENTPEKTRAEVLIAHPRWKYIGPGETIRFEWQIGKWGWAGFAGESARQYATRSQPASTELKEFTTSLPAISLSPLSPGYYDCEIWFKDKFPDLRVIVQNCVKIVEEGPPPGIELQPGGNTVKWTGGPTYVADALGNCVDYVEIFYVLRETDQVWIQITADLWDSWAIPPDYICGIVVDRACTVTGFVWA